MFEAQAAQLKNGNTRTYEQRFVNPRRAINCT